MIRNRAEIYKELRESIAVFEVVELSAEEKDKINKSFKDKMAKEKDIEKAVKATTDELSAEFGAAKVLSYLTKESQAYKDVELNERKGDLIRYDEDTDSFYVQSVGRDYLLGSENKAKSKYNESFLSEVKKAGDWVLIKEQDVLPIEDTDTAEEEKRKLELNKEKVDFIKRKVKKFFKSFLPDHIDVKFDTEVIDPSEEMPGVYGEDKFIENMIVQLVDTKHASQVKFMLSFDNLQNEVALTDFTVDYGKVVKRPFESFQVIGMLRRFIDKIKTRGYLSEGFKETLLNVFRLEEDAKIELRRLHKNTLGEWFLGSAIEREENLEKGSTMMLIENNIDNIVYMINENYAFSVDAFSCPNIVRA